MAHLLWLAFGAEKQAFGLNYKNSIMKKITLLITIICISFAGISQTIGDKSTELGYDLGQKVLDTGINFFTHYQNGVFICHKLEAPLPIDTNHNGSIYNVYSFDTSICLNDSTMHSQAVMDSCGVMTDSTSKSRIEVTYLSWFAERPYIEIPPQDSIVIK